VTAPWSVKFNEKEIMIFKFFIKVLVSQNKDTVLLLDFFSENGTECCNECE